MASNLDYLNPNLIPLEEKVQAYLDAEKALRTATAALRNEPVPHQEPPQVVAQTDEELPQAVAQLREELARRQAEVLALLPTRDEWVKVNLGYGPSRVGAWRVPATTGAPEQYELRVVH